MLSGTLVFVLICVIIILFNIMSFMSSYMTIALQIFEVLVIVNNISFVNCTTTYDYNSFLTITYTMFLCIIHVMLVCFHVYTRLNMCNIYLSLSLFLSRSKKRNFLSTIINWKSQQNTCLLST